MQNTFRAGRKHNTTVRKSAVPPEKHYRVDT